MAIKDYRISHLASPLARDTDLRKILTRALSVSPTVVDNIRVIRRALDARDKGALRFVWTLGFSMEETLLRRSVRGVELYESPVCPELPLHRCDRGRPVVVGCGPAGLFAAVGLVSRGYKPIVIERGSTIPQRRKQVQQFWRSGELNPESNVQFGEGGAGTFSDGKLTSRGSNWFTAEVFRVLHACGADADILVSHLPHIGTNGIRQVVLELRRRLVEAGVDFLFDTRVDEFIVNKGAIRGVTLSNGDTLDTDRVVLATGHSARDTFRVLSESGVAMEPKAFAMGVRVEHDRDFIDRSQYGSRCDFSITGAASYKLRAQVREQGVYSFCMCPGGMVVQAASESGRSVVNGMSHAGRGMRWSNAALVVGLSVEQIRSLAREFGCEGNVLVGVELQRKLEASCFSCTQGYSAPAQRITDFLAGRAGPLPHTSILPAASPQRLDHLLPSAVVEPLGAALRAFDRQIPGFIDGGVLLAPESRTSSPVRILRNPVDRMSPSLYGLLPVGEGAGYAGGIISSAADGLRTGLSFEAQETSRTAGLSLL